MASLLAILDAGLLQGCIQCLLALSVVITLLSLDFPDLSIEGTFPFGAALGAVLLVDARVPWYVALLGVVLAGSAAGAVTGLLHVRFRMSKLLSGIAVAAMLYSGGLLVMGGRAGVSLLGSKTFFSTGESWDQWFNAMMPPYAGAFLHPGSLAAAALAAGVAFLGVNGLLLSELGTVLRAVGTNEAALRHYGRRAGAYKIVGVAVANGLAALAGTLSSQFQGFANVNMGVGVLASSLLSVVLGQEIFARLKFRTEGTIRVTVAALVGATTYELLIAAIMAVGAPPTALRFLSGFALVLIVALRSRRSEVSFSW